MPDSKVILYLSNRQTTHNRNILRGLNSVFHKNEGWDVWNIPIGAQPSKLDRYFESINVAGVVARGSDLLLTDYFSEKNVPFVSIESMNSHDGDASADLTPDEHSVPIIVAEEFNRLGFKKWAYIHWAGYRWSEYRKKRFELCAKYSGVELHVLTINSDNEWDMIIDTAEWLKALPKPCGVFGCNDKAALDVVRAATSASISIPDELAVIGVDNDVLLCEGGGTWLSSVDLHIKELGVHAAKQLRDLIKVTEAGGEVPFEPQSDTAIKPSLIIRESSQHVDHYLLTFQQASGKIREHELKGISVDELATLCSVSRRCLERAFERYAKKSPAAVIRGIRAEAIVRVIISQDVSLEKLAEYTGFADASGLSNFIRRATGIPPSEHRERHKRDLGIE